MMANDFLWHRVSNEEIEEIKIQAKKIMDNFSKKLESIKIGEIEDVESKLKCEREEKNGKECDKKFRDFMFENAPDKNEDFILAERAKWE